MAWSSLPMRLNRRRTSPMVSLIPGGARARAPGWFLWSCFLVWGVCSGQRAVIVHRSRVPFLDLCLMTARKASASIARVMCRYQA